jgi:hypothetical protein
LQRPRVAVVLGALGVLSIATKLVFAARFDGFLTGDDLEVVETALKYSTNFDYTPWSLRNLLHPIVLVSPLLRTAESFGTLTPELATFLAAVPTALFSTAAIALVFALARRIGATDNVALVAAFLYAVHWLPWAYGGTPYPRPISTAFFLAAILLATASRRPLLCGFLAGVLAAAACAIRFTEGVLLIPLLGFAWVRSRDPRRIGAIVGGFFVGAVLLLGVFDALVWGRPFRSLSEFVRIMFVEIPPPSASGDKPWFHYGRNVIRWVSPIHLILIVLAMRDRRARVPLAMALTMVVLLSGFRYKQYRYLQAAIPVVAIAGAIGWDRLRQRAQRLAVTALVLAAAYGGIASVLLLREKSQPAVDAARYIARMDPPPRSLVVEQAWAYGERLYLQNVDLHDVAPVRPLDPAVVRAALVGADAAAFYDKDLRPEALQAIAESGFHASRYFDRDSAKVVTVFRRAAEVR